MTTIRVIDFETSGAEPPQAEVCEVGICDLDLEAKSIGAPKSWLCRVNEMPPEVRAVHHITLADCEPYDPFSVEPLLSGNPTAFAAHNASFEMKFFTPPVYIICTYRTMRMAERSKPQ